MEANPRILVIGSSGFLGSNLLSGLKANDMPVLGADRSLIDLSRPISPGFVSYLREHRFTHVVICAAMTDVESCFRDPELSWRVNVEGTGALLKLIARLGLKPIFFSSDYVFSGASHPYREDDPRNPATEYGRQKLEIERFLESEFEEYLIFRTSKLMSTTSHPRSILSPIIRELSAGRPIRCFEDQSLNPVFVEEIADVIRGSVERNLSGTYHLGTQRIFTRLELARFLAERLELDSSLIQPIRLADFPFSEPRSCNNTIICDKIGRVLGFKFRELEDAIPDIRRSFQTVPPQPS